MTENVIFVGKQNHSQQMGDDKIYKQIIKREWIWYSTGQPDALKSSPNMRYINKNILFLFQNYSYFSINLQLVRDCCYTTEHMYPERISNFIYQCLDSTNKNKLLLKLLY